MPRCKHCPIFAQGAGGLGIGVVVGYTEIQPVLTCLGVDEGGNRPPLLFRSESDEGVQEEVVEWDSAVNFGYYSPTLYMGGGITGMLMRCTDALGFPYRLVLYAGYGGTGGLYPHLADEGEQDPFRAVYYLTELGSTITVKLAPVP